MIFTVTTHWMIIEFFAVIACIESTIDQIKLKYLIGNKKSYTLSITLSDR